MVRFGLIGTDGCAEKFYLANRYSRGFELTAVCDDDREQARQFCFQKGQVKCYDSIEELAEDEEVDAVYISGYVSSHFRQASVLMKAGKHVLCRAPLAADLEEAEELFRIAAKEDVVLMEAAPSLYTPGFGKMSAHVHSLGTIRRATFQHCYAAPEYENYKRGAHSEAFDPEISGGALMEIGACPAACMVSLFGKPEDIKASGICLDTGADVTGSILLTYKDMTGEILYSAAAPAAVPSQIQGEEGSMLIREIENVKDLKIYRGKVNQTIHFEQSDNTLNHVTAAFMKAVRSGTGWEKARDDTLETIRILEEAGKQIGRKEE